MTENSHIDASNCVFCCCRRSRLGYITHSAFRRARAFRLHTSLATNMWSFETRLLKSRIQRSPKTLRHGPVSSLRQWRRRRASLNHFLSKLMAFSFCSSKSYMVQCKRDHLRDFVRYCNSVDFDISFSSMPPPGQYYHQSSQVRKTPAHAYALCCPEGVRTHSDDLSNSFNCLTARHSAYVSCWECSSYLFGASRWSVSPRPRSA